MKKSRIVGFAAVMAAMAAQGEWLPGLSPALTPALIPAPREMKIGDKKCWANAPVKVEKVPGMPVEGYELSVATNGITIRHGDEAGLYWANLTLNQIREHCGGKAIPSLEIKDSPRFRWRGLHFDDVRHFFGKETVKRTIDEMARCKLNVFHWHLTDDQGWRFQVPGYEDLEDYGGEFGDAESSPGANGSAAGRRFSVRQHYTDDDIREIVAYAKERHITIVPEVEFPGHFYCALCAYPEFACNPENIRKQGRNPTVKGGGTDVMCAGNPAAIKFIEKALDHICELFPSKVIHIGGDECPTDAWKTCEKCQALVKKKNLGGVERIQPWLTRHFVDYLAKKGRWAIGWDEIFAGDAAKTLPATVVGMMRWHPSSDARQKRNIRGVEEGRLIVCATANNCYFDYEQGLPDDPFDYWRLGRSDRIVTLEKAYALDPLDGIPEKAQANVVGGECCNWSEFTPDRATREWKMWPRALATAEVLWTYPDPAKRDIGDFSRRAELVRRRMLKRHVNCAPVPPRAPNTLRLMQYNILHGKQATGRFDLTDIIEIVRRENPDFVGLNEVDWKTTRVDGIDEAGVIGEFTGMYSTFGKSIDYKGGGYGNAVLSREKPLNSITVPLPGKEPRSLILCEFKDCWFGSMHLSWRNDGVQSAEIIRDLIEEKARTKPVFLCGDWNADYEEPTLLKLREYMTVISNLKGRTFSGFRRYTPGHLCCGDFLAVDTAHADSFSIHDTHEIVDDMTSDHYPIAVVLESSKPPTDDWASGMTAQEDDLMLPAVTTSAPKAAPPAPKVAPPAPPAPKAEETDPEDAPPPEPEFAPPAPPEPANVPTLRIATYNINNGLAKFGSDFKYAIDRQLDNLEWENLDVFGLTEVSKKMKSSDYADAPADIAEITGRHVEYAEAEARDEGTSGNAVVSKVMPLAAIRIELPCGGGQKCSLLLCEFNDYWFGSTRFDTRLDNQFKSVEIVRGVVEDLAKAKPVFISGDLNNEPNSTTLRRMGEFMTILNNPNAHTYNGFDERPKDRKICLDYIAVDNAHAHLFPVAVRRVKINSSLSDHNAVLMTVGLGDDE